MPRFLRVILAFLFVFASMLLAVRMIGGMRTAKFAIVFTNRDGSPCKGPCLFGIRPGETTVSEAVALLKSHPFMLKFPVLNDDPFVAGDLQNGPSIFFSKTPDGLVDTIGLSY